MARATLRGDFVQLRGAVTRIKKMARGGTVQDIARVAAPSLDALVQQEFDRGTNPYGTAWKPLAASTVARGRSAPPLTDTGAMRGGTTVKPADTSIVMQSPAPAFLHQYGWRLRLAKPKAKRSKGQVIAMMTHKTGGPARPIFPDGRIPNGWRQLVRKLAREKIGLGK